MRKIEDVLRLHARGLSTRRISLATGVGKTTVIEYLAPVDDGRPVLAAARRSERRGAGPAAVPAAGCRPGSGAGSQPDWAMVARELKRPGVTLMMLWEEYRGRQPDGYGYSPSATCSAVRAAPLAGHAPAPRRGRQGVRRLLRQAADGDRPGLRDGAAGGDLRRRAGRVELHLCRGDLDPDAAGLDWRPHPHVRLLRRGAARWSSPNMCPGTYSGLRAAHRYVAEPDDHAASRPILCQRKGT